MSNKKIKQVKEYEGMLTCIFEHEVVKSTAEYEWTGPKLSRAMWNEVLAFFRWTQATTKSESQVRLYCNHLTGEWRAWAYPQTEGTGMTTREIDNEDTKVQRAQFSDADGWFYYGTAHHHCTGSAFQSSVDSANEQNQDGIHITVGKLESDQYDIDIRLYQSGYKIIDWEIEEFWDPGDIISNIPMHVRQFLPKDYPQRMVLLQMGTPPPNNQEFPEVWKTNLIREVRVFPKTYTHSPGYYQHGTFKKTFLERSSFESSFDKDRFVADMLTYLTDQAKTEVGMTLEEATNILKNLKANCQLMHCDVFDIMVRNDIRFDVAIEMMGVIEEKIKERMKERELEVELELKVGKMRGRSQARLGLPTGGNGAIVAPNGHAGAVEHMENEGNPHHYHGYGQGYGAGG